MRAEGVVILDRYQRVHASAYGAWLGGGKWLARRVDEVRPGFSAELEGVVREALEGRPSGLAALVDEVLAPCGGRMREGYRRSGYPSSAAPASHTGP
ncbi:hypothetical protein GCM10010277_70840 [Streptomyces longisporoflavus]|nr:hypothetical protein GCM10010277_70840 [Streptomyces longisporoflavus]